MEITLREPRELVECNPTDLVVKHNFSKGVYVRELEIPKGTLIEGKRSREKCINMLIKGKMLVHDGTGIHEIEAPYIVEAQAFTKKVGFALEDSVWVNIHNTDSTDLDEIEKQVIISEEEYLMLEHKEVD